MEYKVCTACNVEKHRDDFGKRKDRPCGITAICKPCRNHKRREYILKDNYGITLEEYAEMKENQGGTCDICNKACKSGRRLAVDHCHKSGNVRALLCTKCNTALGAVNDDPEILYTMISYLKEHEVIDDDQGES